MSTTDDDLYNIIDQSILFTISIRTENSQESVGCAIVEARLKLNDQAKQAIKDLIDKARIDELEQLQKKHTRTYRQTVTDNNGDVYVEDSHSYISIYETQERIAQLKGDK